MVHFWYKLCSEIVTVTEPSSTYAGAAPRNRQPAPPARETSRQAGRQVDGAQYTMSTDGQRTVVGEQSSRLPPRTRPPGLPAARQGPHLP